MVKTSVIIPICLLLWSIWSLRSSSNSVQFNRFDKNATLPLRFILAMLVVFTHLPMPQCLKLGTSAVAVFFFISGYGMVKSYSQKGSTYLQGCTRRTAAKLFGPYIVCAAIWAIRRFVGSFYSSNYEYNLDFIWRGIVAGNINVILPYSWFVWALFAFSIIFVVSFRYAKRPLLWVALGLLMYYGVVRYGFCYGRYWYFSTWSFLVGCVYSKYEEAILKIINRLRWKFPLSLGFVYAIISAIPCLAEIENAMLGVIAVLILYLHPLPRWKWLIILGGISYEIYLTHGIVADVLATVMGMAKFSSSLLLICGTITATMLFAYGLHMGWLRVQKLCQR